MFFIRQGATHKVTLGPAVAVGDGFTPVTSLSVATADEAEVILHDNGTVVDISGYTFAAITTADGYYHLTLQSGISNTVGHLTVVINDDSLILPLRADFTVVEEAVYDAFYAASAPGLVGTAQTGDSYAIVNSGTHGNSAIKTETAAILADTAEIGAAGAGLTALASQASVNTIDDFLDTEVAAIKAVTDALAAATTPPSAPPAANATLLQIAAWLLMLSRNKIEQTATTQTVYADNGSTAVATSTVSDDSTTLTRGEFS